MARVVRLSVDVAYLASHDGLDPSIRFGVEIEGVASVRAREWLPHPEPCERVAGESRAAEAARIDAWRAKGRMSSLDWGDTVRRVSESGMDVSDGDVLLAPHGVALRVSGLLQEDPLRWIVLEIAGREIRWTRSDGAPWSAEHLEDLAGRYWDDFAARGEKRRRSRAHPHATRYDDDWLARLDVRSLRAHLDALEALPEDAPAELAELSDELVYARAQPEWSELRARVLAELAKRGA